MSTRVQRLEPARRRRIHREPGGGHHHLRQRGGRHRHLRPDAERAGLRRATSTRRSGSCTRASTAVRPSSPPDRVLVVGASHSGCDIAYEAAEHRPTTLVGRDCGQIPVRWGSRALRYTFPVIAFLWRHVLTRRTPDRPQGDGRRSATTAARCCGSSATTSHGRGVERVLYRVTGVSDGRPVLGRRPSRRREPPSSGAPASGRSSTGSTCRSSVRTATRGSTAASSSRCPGLFFCGLAFQYAFSSMVFLGVGRDAEYVARRIDARRVTPSRLAAAA